MVWRRNCVNGRFIRILWLSTMASVHARNRQRRDTQMEIYRKEHFQLKMGKPVAEQRDGGGTASDREKKKMKTFHGLHDVEGA